MEERSKYLSHTVHYVKFTHGICGLTQSSQWAWEVQIIIVCMISPHSSTLAWRIPWVEEPGKLQCMGSWRVGHNWAERLHFHFSLSCTGEGNGNPLQCSCLENPRDGGRLVGCHLWGHTESTLLKWLSSSIAVHIKRLCFSLLPLFTPSLFFLSFLLLHNFLLHSVSSCFRVLLCFWAWLVDIRLFCPASKQVEK